MQHGNSASSPLKEKQSQANVLRSLKHLIISNHFETDYQWVPSHQDDHTKWAALTLRERLNIIVDELAKLALAAAIADGIFIDRELPFEQVRITIRGRKVAGSLRTAINKHWSATVAREFFHAKHIVNRYHFNIVYWDGIESAKMDFPKMFWVWMTKHVSKFCGTNRQLSRYDPMVKNVCPSCWQEDESSKHITRCRDGGCRSMLEHSSTRW